MKQQQTSAVSSQELTACPLPNNSASFVTCVDKRIVFSMSFVRWLSVIDARELDYELSELCNATAAIACTFTTGLGSSLATLWQSYEAGQLDAGRVAMAHG